MHLGLQLLRPKPETKLEPHLEPARPNRQLFSNQPKQHMAPSEL